MKRNIVNLVHFIRGCEPRMTVDLIRPVREQIALGEEFGLATTFLAQYDALENEEICALLRRAATDGGESVELGVWLEVMEPLVKAAGLEWRGRYPWDWHAHCGFTVGYTPRERERIADELMRFFKEKFGYYPRVVGSWILDAHTLEYLAQHYAIDASCNCKDQWGTDGYTLWGGYYTGAYYPARRNAFSPAQSAGEQIGVPVFRMLGSDPVDQYDLGLDLESGGAASQSVVTLEPVYTGGEGGGGSPDWVDWFLRENFNGKCLTYAYAQAGQENSFGWAAMQNGLRDQYAKLRALQQKGALTVEPLGASGRWFRGQFACTPPTALAVTANWKDADKASPRHSYWYSCKNYRMNLYQEGDRLWIRDWYRFDEAYEERYLDSVERRDVLAFDTLPIVDGNRFSGGGVRAGLYLYYDAAPLTVASVAYAEEDRSVLLTCTGTPCGTLVLHLHEAGITLATPNRPAGALELRFLENPRCAALPERSINGQELTLRHRGFPYRLLLHGGVFAQEEDGLRVRMTAAEMGILMA
ncbi:MAG: hypothetical protein LBS96_04120 [Oscillospiraceae bacterium]|nr:hypothetical protein [Oscillospiraceae bacterium]